MWCKMHWCYFPNFVSYLFVLSFACLLICIAGLQPNENASKKDKVSKDTKGSVKEDALNREQSEAQIASELEFYLGVPPRTGELRSLLYVVRQRFESCVQNFDRSNEADMRSVVSVLAKCKLLSHQSSNLPPVECVSALDNPMPQLEDSLAAKQYRSLWCAQRDCAQIEKLHNFARKRSNESCALSMMRLAKHHLFDVFKRHQVLSKAHRYFTCAKIATLNQQLSRTELIFTSFMERFLFGLAIVHKVPKQRLSVEAMQAYLSSSGTLYQAPQNETLCGRSFGLLMKTYSSFFPHKYTQLLERVLRGSKPSISVSHPIVTWSGMLEYNRFVRPLLHVHQISSDIITDFEEAMRPVAQWFRKGHSTAHTFDDAQYQRLALYMEHFERRILLLTLQPALLDQETFPCKQERTFMQQIWRYFSTEFPREFFFANMVYLLIFGANFTARHLFTDLMPVSGPKPFSRTLWLEAERLSYELDREWLFVLLGVVLFLLAISLALFVKSSADQERRLHSS